jgi:hypothetical protein
MGGSLNTSPVETRGTDVGMNTNACTRIVILVWVMDGATPQTLVDPALTSHHTHGAKQNARNARNVRSSKVSQVSRPTECPAKRALL